MTEKFTKQILVQENDIDELNHVNNVRYVQWMQDIAKEHWFSSIKNKLNSTYIWVVASHFIEYKSSAVLNDELTIDTFIEKFEGPMSFRRVEIRNKKTNRIIVTALTKWCLIDIETKRPILVPEEILNLE
jgi:acyl-CoA thioester hydrolase